MKNALGKAPLPVAILLFGIIGIVKLRDQAGVQSGYLMAGVSILLAGVWCALEVIDRADRRTETKEAAAERDRAAWEKILDRRDARRRAGQQDSEQDPTEGENDE